MKRSLREMVVGRRVARKCRLYRKRVNRLYWEWLRVCRLYREGLWVNVGGTICRECYGRGGTGECSARKPC